MDSLPRRGLEFQGDPIYLPAKTEWLCGRPDNPHRVETLVTDDGLADLLAPRWNQAASRGRDESFHSCLSEQQALLGNS